VQFIRTDVPRLTDLGYLKLLADAIFDRVDMYLINACIAGPGFPDDTTEEVCRVKTMKLGVKNARRGMRWLLTATVRSC
jgi:hypothetical protein